MNDNEFDWHATELAQTAPHVPPPELPGGRSAAGEVEGKTDAPELVEISTVRVLGDIGTRLERSPAQDSQATADAVPADTAAARGTNRGVWLAIAALVAVGLLAWLLIG